MCLEMMVFVLTMLAVAGLALVIRPQELAGFTVRATGLHQLHLHRSGLPPLCAVHSSSKDVREPTCSVPWTPCRSAHLARAAVSG